MELFLAPHTEELKPRGGGSLFGKIKADKHQLREIFHLHHDPITQPKAAQSRHVACSCTVSMFRAAEGGVSAAGRSAVEMESAVVSGRSAR